MRTTLKRGVGRSAAANGNGRALLPPGVLSPVVQYSQPPPPPRRKLRVAGKVLFVLLALGLMAASALAAGSWLYGEGRVDTLQARGKKAARVAKRLDIPLPGKPAIALFLGYDRRHGEGPGIPARSDTLMLVRVDPTEDAESITLFSFPRDLEAEIHCPGRPPLGTDRINAAYATCGEEGAVETVKALTGLPINYLVTIDFRGFTQVVDKLGGVWIDVDRRYYNPEGTGFATIDLQPGYQKLFGGDTLAFVRYRHTDNDLYRNARQQIFVRALKERLSHSFDPENVLEVTRALSNNIKVTVGGGKRLSLKNVASYALLGYSIPSGNVIRVKLDPNSVAGTGIWGDLLRVSPETIDDAVDQFLNPDVDAPEKAAARALGQKVRLKSGLPPNQVSIVSLNGNNVDGAAANASAQLAERGYETVLPPAGMDANAPTFDYFRTTVYYRADRKDAELAAQQVANLFGSADIEPLVRGRLLRLANGATLVAVVGQTFRGTLAPAPKDRTPERKPPAVVTNPDVSRPAVLRAQRSTPFPLYLPTVLERTSVIDEERPARVYRINAAHKAVRLTFRTGTSEYWGIEQTDWDDAPVFEGRNTTRKIKGREYDLYFSGNRLHMVVLRDGERSYWVVNTLLDSLSNETMIAVARGLQPLRKG
ncbi:MAG: LCP family protein [Gaiellaceae bacterium]